MGHLQEFFNLLYSVESNWELGMLKIANDVSLLGVAASRLGHSIRSLLPNWLYSSSGKVSRSLKSLLRFLFLFFTWTAAWEKNLTMDNLRKCSIRIVDWCCMCKNGGETTDRLLLYCAYATDIWSMVFCLFGIQWIMPEKTMNAYWTRFWETSLCWCMEGHSSLCYVHYLDREE